ncbi:hypothetical protein FACS1894141_5560 [Spirochaetia bacterium]|nr:hypothetical protein FACS1894141_5560 [Spirochaetia bacterium]
MAALNGYTLHNGVKIPGIGMGVSSFRAGDIFVRNLSGETMTNAVLAAIDCGYRLFDTAHCYGNERDLGNALSIAYKQKEIAREDLFLTTKIGEFKKGTHFVDPMFYCSKENEGKSIAAIVQESVRESLEKLQTNYIDLLLLHWPTPDFVLFWKELEKLYEAKTF